MSATRVTALCGHEYSRPAGPGRRRKFGDCECDPRRAERREQSCIRCGEQFFWPTPREYCSERCRAAIYRRRKAGLPESDPALQCEMCDKPFVALRSDALRCEECSGRAFARLPERTCPVCGEQYAPTKRKQSSCSNACAQRAWKSANRKPEPWSERRKANYQKRRALKAQLPADDILPLDVYERDGWTCGICGVAVDRDRSWPDPMSPSLDHITPLSRGGHHVLENVQLAHLTCNVKKGARE